MINGSKSMHHGRPERSQLFAATKTEANSGWLSGEEGGSTRANSQVGKGARCACPPPNLQILWPWWLNQWWFTREEACTENKKLAVCFTEEAA